MKQLPLGMHYLDTISNTERGYESDVGSAYDANSQTSDILSMGKSEPTTWSQVTSTYPLLIGSNDSDNDTDDTGTD